MHVVTQTPPPPQASGGSPVDDRDPLGIADHAPLLRAWLDAEDAVRTGTLTPFTIPGHKQRTDLLGRLTQGDLPLYGGLAPIKAADELLARAEQLAAEHFGADWCRFSVGGSTHGNQALALGVGRPGRPVVVARTLHRSGLSALILAGLNPVWVHPRLHEQTHLPLGVDPGAVRAALAEHPDACAVLLTDPSYVGTCGDLPALADVAHAAGVPLILDAAWGAHFGAHPALPPHPLAAGADALVTSAHKTLPALNQATYVLARTTRTGGLLDADRLTRAFETGHTTSPSGAILASLDAARAVLALHGQALAEELLRLVTLARRRLAAVPGLRVLDPGTGVAGAAGRAGTVRLDPAKLVLQLAGTGAHGHAVEADLVAAGLPVELADRDTLIPMITLADDEDGVDRLLSTLEASIARHGGPARSPGRNPAWAIAAGSITQQALSPREAFFADHERVPWAQAAGRVCAEIVAPYPPGVPVLAPGELVTPEALAAVAAARADGSRIAYAADPTLSTLEVVRVRQS